MGKLNGNPPIARAVRDVRLDNRAARERLTARKKACYRVIEAGKHIGYYKGLRTGFWLARTFDGTRYSEKKLGTADDTLDANGLDVLSFSEAQASARKWFDELASAGHAMPAGPYSITNACDDYRKDYQHRRGKDEYNTSLRLDRIKVALGAIEVRKLTATQIKAWHRAMGEEGRLTRSRKLDDAGARKRIALDPTDADAKRRRLATANRNLTVLKAVLNLAFKSQEELGVFDPAWEAATPTREVEGPKIRHLTDAEGVRLLNACPADFRDLVAAALLTGCRYGELCRLKVQDFDAAAAAIRVEVSKSGKSRSVALTDEGVAHFSRLAAGKGRDALLLVQYGGEGWSTSHQIRRMVEACENAKIVPAVGFHILRHTYGSQLAMKGAVSTPVGFQASVAE